MLFLSLLTVGFSLFLFSGKWFRTNHIFGAQLRMRPSERKRNLASFPAEDETQVPIPGTVDWARSYSWSTPKWRRYGENAFSFHLFPVTSTPIIPLNYPKLRPGGKQVGSNAAIVSVGVLRNRLWFGKIPSHRVIVRHHRLRRGTDSLVT